MAVLKELLEARDNRAEKQKMLIDKYGLPLISFTVNMPGPVKSTPLVTKIFDAGCDKLVSSLKEVGKASEYFEKRDLVTGPEAYLVVDMDEHSLKKLAVCIEDGHPIGRLWDIDVIGHDGVSISREALAYPRRGCLICEKDAHVCARSREHSVEKLINRIQFIAGEYFKRKE